MFGSYLVAAFETAIALVRVNRHSLEDWEERLLEARDVRTDLPASKSELRTVISNMESNR